MLPSIEDIVRKRQHAQKRLKNFSLILFILGSMPMIFALTESLANFRWQIYGWDNMIAYCTMFTLPGIIVLILNRRLSHWLVPLPKPECPECRYFLKNLTKARCPECGLKLPEAMIHPPYASREPESTNEPG